MRRILAAALLVTTLLFAADNKLALEHPVVSESEDGVPVPSDLRFRPGEVVFFSCQVSGYARQDKGDDTVVDLEYTVEARDATGLLLVPIETGKIASTLTSEDKKWLPKIRHSIALPGLLDPGEYRIIVKVKDNLARGAVAEASVALPVEAREVAPSDTLVVRNFRFLRGEEDRDPLPVAAYRPGDTVWARFEMTGYKLGDGNAFDIEYGLKVLRPSGETTYDQPKAAEEKSQSFYPQRYTPGVLSLRLPPDLARGRYTVVLTVRDNLGGQTAESRFPFTVE